MLRSRVTLPQAALINERAPVKPPVPVDDTAAERAPVGDPLTSTVDLPGTSHGGNESEKADKVAIGFRVPATGISDEHILHTLSEHANPRRWIPQPCIDPACADSAEPSACPVMAQVLNSSLSSQQNWPRSFAGGQSPHSTCRQTGRRDLCSRGVR